MLLLVHIVELAASSVVVVHIGYSVVVALLEVDSLVPAHFVLQRFVDMAHIYNIQYEFITIIIIKKSCPRMLEDSTSVSSARTGQAIAKRSVIFDTRRFFFNSQILDF